MSIFEKIGKQLGVNAEPTDAPEKEKKYFYIDKEKAQQIEKEYAEFREIVSLNSNDYYSAASNAGMFIVYNMRNMAEQKRKNRVSK